MRKYGIDNFSFEIIEECQIEQLNEREIYWISQYNSNLPEFGYNLTKGGNNFVPQKLTEKEVFEIINLLQNTIISQENIAKKYNVSQRFISGINKGENWIQQDLIYPLRKNGVVNKFKNQEDVTTEDIQSYDNKSYCEECGIEVYLGSCLCSKCAAKKRRKVQNRPDRKELKQLIRVLSFTQIAKQYNVSDTAIKKWCKNEKLPYTKKEINSYSDEDWELI